MSMEVSGISVMAQAMRNQTFGAELVSKTLDNMNSGNHSGMNDMSRTYDFVKDVLGPHAQGQSVLASMEQGVGGIANTYT